jgi:hypothetical protein
MVIFAMKGDGDDKRKLMRFLCKQLSFGTGTNGIPKKKER